MTNVGDDEDRKLSGMTKSGQCRGRQGEGNFWGEERRKEKAPVTTVEDDREGNGGRIEWDLAEMMEEAKDALRVQGEDALSMCPNKEFPRLARTSHGMGPLGRSMPTGGD